MGAKPSSVCPDVTARRGRLAKTESWSDFGEFDDTAPVFPVARGLGEGACRQGRPPAGSRARSQASAGPVADQDRDDRGDRRRDHDRHANLDNAGDAHDQAGDPEEHPDQADEGVSSQSTPR